MVENKIYSKINMKIFAGIFSAATLIFSILYFFYIIKRDENNNHNKNEIKQKLESQTADDPRLTYSSPFRNIKPDTQYVGDSVCAKCHQNIAHTFHNHPMGQSAEYVTGQNLFEKFSNNGKTTSNSGLFDLSAIKDSHGMRHEISATDKNISSDKISLNANIAIGSGTRGRSYLTVNDGWIWQTPISWFGPEEKWDISPGFQVSKTLLRPISSPCLYCHTDSVKPIADTSNRYEEPVFSKQAAISCERCHGPGDIHVNERTNNLQLTMIDNIDTSIVNPKHLSPALQRSICQQCHLQGHERVNRRGRNMFEYRPGLPFDLFVSVYVKPDASHSNKSVGQFEQMEQSQCFIKSKGTMTCTSCHDPHEVPTSANVLSEFRKKCQTCHSQPQTKTCSDTMENRTAKKDQCVSCHMPKASSSNIAHTSVTNHRVPRIATGQKTPNDNQALFNASPLIRFVNNDTLKPSELDRDLGIALARYSKTQRRQQHQFNADPRSLALDKLKTSTALWPHDKEALESLVDMVDEKRSPDEKLTLAKNFHQLAPESESAIAILANMATTVGDLNLALKMCNQWVVKNPKSYDPLIARAFIQLKKSNWAEAEADCKAALKIHPFHAEAHLYLAICLHKLGHVEAGAKEAKIAADLESDQSQRSFMRDWYRRAIQ